MHRSGTSMLSRILNLLNVHMGAKINIHDESLFYKELNDTLLKKIHCYWDAPSNARLLTSDKAAVNQLIKYAEKRITSWRYKWYYQGWSNYNHWGWKDPRSILTLPVFNSIYPKAKYIFIVRNGVDVANSLQQRELKRIDKKLNINTSIRCRSLVESFNLWEEYMQVYELNKSIICPENLFEIRYEDLVNNNESYISNLLYFLEAENTYLHGPTFGMHSDSMGVFKKSEELIAFYQKVKDSKYMKQYGYSELLQ